MHTKVFVGNLSFKTKADELAAEFSPAGRVVSANIITRGPRSLGYGFVELESEEDARKAVTLLNKRNVDGREINVEIAKPRDEAKLAEKRAAREARRGRGGRPRRGGRAPSDAAPAGEGANNNNISSSNAPQAGPVRGRGRRFSGPRRGGSSAASGEGQAPNVSGGSSPSSQQPPRARRPRRSNPRNRDLANRSQSQTTLFVANLPFSLDDNGLLDLFKEHKATKAHVVKNRNNRSKGFGFVEFANEDDQKAALAASDKLTSETRPLIVKIALTPPEGVNPQAAPASGAAASSSSTPSDSKDAAKDTKAAEGTKSS